MADMSSERLNIMAMVCAMESERHSMASMDEPVNTSLNGDTDKPTSKTQPSLSGIQTITPPQDSQNLQPDQNDFVRATPTVSKQDFGEALAKYSSLVSPPLTAAESVTLSRRTSQSSYTLSETSGHGSNETPSTTVPSQETKAVDPETPYNITWTELDMILENVFKGVKITPDMILPEGCTSIWLPDKQISEENRLVTPQDLVKRMEFFLAYRIPHVAPECGSATARTTLWNTRDPWGPAKRMAYAGLLQQYPSGTQKVLWPIRALFYGGKPSQFEQEYQFSSEEEAMPSYRPKPGKPAKPAKRRPSRKSPKSKAKPPDVGPGPQTRRATQANENAILPAAKAEPPQTRQATQTVQATENVKLRSTTPETEDLVELEEKTASPPPRVPKKRKRTESDEPAEKPAKKSTSRTKNTRHAYDEGKSASSSELFARHIKSTLNARSSDKNNYKVFEDAILPDNSQSVNLSQPNLKHAVDPANRLEDHGDPLGLHSQEVSLCKDLAITFDTYRCQKARFFLGLAMFIQYNYRALERNGADFKLWNVGKSQCQLVNNMDVNKLSDMFAAFETWGWAELMGTKDASTKKFTLSASYLQRFPESHRFKLLKEVAEWEAANVADHAKRVVKVATE